MIYDLSNNIGLERASGEFNRLIENKSMVEIKQIKRTRSNLQNRALHLLFKQVSEQLNELGIAFVYKGLRGSEFETEWTPELFKEFTWKPIQKAMFGIESTTKINTEQINKVFDVINRFFADRGVKVAFPNKFDYYLKFYMK